MRINFTRDRRDSHDASVQELTNRQLNLSKHHDQVVGALDMLFQGF
jgi:hypothetical protein